MLEKFNVLIKDKVDWKIKDILPTCLVAGEFAGTLTEEGAKLLDPSGTFQAGCPLVPPEGDMGTGMVATNSVAVNTGNASIGTSSNLTFVTGKILKPDPHINIIAGPTGNVAALIHVSNGTTDINKWVELVYQAMQLGGVNITKGELFEKLFRLALTAEPDCGGLLHFNTASGEPLLGTNEGRPLFLRAPNAHMDLANLMRSNIYASVAAIRVGLDIVEQQGVKIEKVTGHGGFFKTRGVGSYLMSAAIRCPIVNLYSSGEGGPYGMALLASYYLERKEGETLEAYLDKVFADSESDVTMAEQKDIDGFNAYYRHYVECIPTLKSAVSNYKIK